MLSCCTVKCYGDAFELICYEFNFFFKYVFFKINNGAAMAVLAAPLPVALILLHSTASNLDNLSCPAALVAFIKNN